MAAMISENSYLVPNRVKAAYAQKNKLLMVVTDLGEDMDENSDDIVHGLEQLKKNILVKIDNTRKAVKVMKLKSKESETKDLIQELYY